MSHTLSIQQASANLRELVHSLKPGDEIVLTENNLPIARIVSSPPARTGEPGGWIGKFEIIDDACDDVILDHFREYTP